MTLTRQSARISSNELLTHVRDNGKKPMNVAIAKVELARRELTEA